MSRADGVHQGPATPEVAGPAGPARDRAPAVTRVRGWLAVGVAVVWVVWQLWIAATVPLQPVHMRSLHLAFGFTAAFLMLPGWLSKKRPVIGLVGDLALAALAVLALMHLYVNFAAPDFRRVVNPLPVDIVLGVVMLVVLLVGLWRATGAALAITVVAFVAYALFGQYIPGMVGHAGFPIKRIVSILYLQLEGLLGSTTGASATVIFPVLVFGAMLVALGGGTFFTELSIAGLGRLRGAGGKVAVVASALFSTVSGTGGSGVATTGVFTIPLMQRTGYRGTQAVGIESAASVGGQILPPVMGASAFAMAELLSVPYSTIVTHAVIPGALYFLTVFVLVHLEARRSGLRPIDRSEVPPMRTVMKNGWHFLVPLVVLIYLIAFAQISVSRAALYSTAVLVGLDLASRAIRRQPLHLRRLVDGSVGAAKSALIVATAVAGIQVVIGVVGLTGIGIKLSSLLLTLAGGSLFVLLILTMIASIILGTGLPTLPTYMVLAILVAPALQDFGVAAIAAHMFILYFGVFSDLTPPTALGPTIGAGIAKAPLLGSMVASMKYGLLGFVLPYLFIYSPGLLGIGSPTQILLAVAQAVAVVAILGAALAGYTWWPLGWPGRIVAGVSGVLAATPWAPSVALGLAVATVGVIAQFLWRRRTASSTPKSNSPDLPSTADASA